LAQSATVPSAFKRVTFNRRLIMKSPAASRIIATFASAFAMAFSATGVGAAPASKAHCDKVTGTASGFFTGPVTVATNVSLFIDGNSVDATSLATLLSSSVAGDGATLATSSHVFTVGTSTFTTLDRAILTPTNTPSVLRLNSHLDVSGGTGDLANADGTFAAHGFIDFSDGSVVWEIRGSLCAGL
jgi:hypothetical protein